MALIWAAGILWFAYGVAGSAPSASTNAEQPTDVTGAAITDDDAKRFEQAVNGL
jgi:hypothetical protein